jgi:hypothetical protein
MDAHTVINLPIDYVDRDIVADFSNLVCCVEHYLIVQVRCSFIILVAFQNNMTRWLLLNSLLMRSSAGYLLQLTVAILVITVGLVICIPVDQFGFY